MEMTTSRIGFEEENDHLKVEVEYSLDINYDHVSDCRIVLDVTSKGCAKLELGEDVKKRDRGSAPGACLFFWPYMT